MKDQVLNTTVIHASASSISFFYRKVQKIQRLCSTLFDQISEQHPSMDLTTVFVSRSISRVTCKSNAGHGVLSRAARHGLGFLGFYQKFIPAL